jgi:putative ABC transport system permease protein
MLKNYLKTALRLLVRNKVYSIINILGLSIGLACAMLIILYVKDEVSYDRFHTGVDHIYRIYSVVARNKVQVTSPDGEGIQMKKMGITGFLQGPRFTEKIPEIRSFVRIRHGYTDIKKDADVKSQPLLYADSSFFSLFSFPLLSGNPKTCLLEPNSIVLSEDAAIRQFGTTDILGKTILLKEKDQWVPHSVMAVAKGCPQNSSIQFDIVLPLKVPASAEATP